MIRKGEPLIIQIHNVAVLNVRTCTSLNYNMFNIRYNSISFFFPYHQMYLGGFSLDMRLSHIDYTIYIYRTHRKKSQSDTNTNIF